MRILHLCSDEKFIDFVIYHFNKHYEGKNTFVILSNKKQLSYVKAKSSSLIILNPKSRIELDNLKKELSDYDNVVVHFLDYYKCKIINNIPSNIKLFWMCWGGDIYEDESFFGIDRILESNTFKKYSQGYFESNLLSRYIFRFFHRNRIFQELYCLKKYNAFRSKLIKTKKITVQRCNYLSTVIPTEFELVKNNINNKEIQYRPFSYGNLSEIMGDLIDVDTKLGSNILLGNSATKTNNHIEAIEILSEANITGDVITPLNYGSSKYSKYLEKYGKQKLGEGFVPLKNFMKKSEYVDLISSCSVMIMNHIRQQAVGNIIIGLYLGMEVYLNSKSVVYAYLRDQGIHVFNFQEEFDIQNIQLDEEKKQKNKDMIEKIWGVKTVERHISNLFN